MTLNRVVAEIFITGLFIASSPILFWCWLDCQHQKTSAWSHLRRRHLHHIFLYMWIIFLGIFIITWREQVADWFIWICVLCTGLFFYSGGLWDLRFERIGVDQREAARLPLLLARLAFRVPFAEVFCGSAIISLGASWLLWPYTALSFIRFTVMVGLIFILLSIKDWRVRSWNRQMLKNGQSPMGPQL